MNGFSLGELCWLFCCPPCPSRIAAKLAFLPPEPTYTVLPPEPQPQQEAGPGAAGPGAGAGAGPGAGAGAGVAGTPPGAGTCSLHLSERADWQYSQRELDAVEVFFSRTARDNRLGCMFVRCAPAGRYTLLFSHGNAVDLGQMCSFYIGLGSRINCNVFSYDYSGYGVSTGKPSEKNLYADIDAAWQALRTRYVATRLARAAPAAAVRLPGPAPCCSGRGRRGLMRRRRWAGRHLLEVVQSDPLPEGGSSPSGPIRVRHLRTTAEGAEEGARCPPALSSTCYGVCFQVLFGDSSNEHRMRSGLGFVRNDRRSRFLGPCLGRFDRL